MAITAELELKGIKMKKGKNEGRKHRTHLKDARRKLDEAGGQIYLPRTRRGFVHSSGSSG